MPHGLPLTLRSRVQHTEMYLGIPAKLENLGNITYMKHSADIKILKILKCHQTFRQLGLRQWLKYLQDYKRFLHTS